MYIFFPTLYPSFLSFILSYISLDLSELNMLKMMEPRCSDGVDLDSSLTELDWLAVLPTTTNEFYKETTPNSLQNIQPKDSGFGEFRSTTATYHSVSQKPIISYTEMIRMALDDSEERKLQIADIYQWISKHFPYYKMTQYSWKNSVRHTLSVNKSFFKVSRSGGKGAEGKGHYWIYVGGNVRSSVPTVAQRRVILTNVTNLQASKDQISNKRGAGCLESRDYLERPHKMTRCSNGHTQMQNLHEEIEANIDDSCDRSYDFSDLIKFESSPCDSSDDRSPLLSLKENTELPNLDLHSLNGNSKCISIKDPVTSDQEYISLDQFTLKSVTSTADMKEPVNFQNNNQDNQKKTPKEPNEGLDISLVDSPASVVNNDVYLTEPIKADSVKSGNCKSADKEGNEKTDQSDISCKDLSTVSELSNWYTDDEHCGSLLTEDLSPDFGLLDLPFVPEINTHSSINKLSRGEFDLNCFF